MKLIKVIWKNAYTGAKEEKEMAVNKSGDGLFMRDKFGAWSQMMGTGQFSAKTPAAMMRKLRRHYEDQIAQMVRGSADGWEI